MNRKYISAVKPLDNYILQVDFVSGSRLLLDMKPYWISCVSVRWQKRSCGAAP